MDFRVRLPHNSLVGEVILKNRAWFHRNPNTGKAEQKLKWKPNETLLIVFQILLQYQIRMNFKDERTITILFIYLFFHLENIITKISLVNERPYKMAKPASLYPGYQRFFFPRVWLDVSVSATGRQADRSSVKGRSILRVTI